MSIQTLDALTVRRAVARVDLLPPEIGEARRFKRLQRGLAAALLGVVGLSGAAYALTAGHVTRAEEALEAERARTAPLMAEQAPYAEAPKVIEQTEAVTRMQLEAAAYDVAWYGYLDALATRAPAGLDLTTLTFAVTPAVAGVAATADPLAVPGVGTVEVSGKTRSQDTVATWMEQLATIPGITSPALNGSSLDAATGAITFSTKATLTDAALQQQR
ncbi:hypothetical protein NUM3379_04980 [Kineococcus sp. NUM-3379]